MFKTINELSCMNSSVDPKNAFSKTSSSDLQNLLKPLFSFFSELQGHRSTFLRVYDQLKWIAQFLGI